MQYLTQVTLYHIVRNLNDVKGSANLWINSVDCLDKACLKHKQYNPDLSSTFRGSGLLLEVEFGTGTLSGEICSDDVYLGGVMVTNQSFAKIEREIGDVFYEVHNNSRESHY